MTHPTPDVAKLRRHAKCAHPYTHTDSSDRNACYDTVSFFDEPSNRLALLEAWEERDRYRAALEDAYKAMNHLGDILNEHDMAEKESIEFATPLFEHVQRVLSSTGGTDE